MKRLNALLNHWYLEGGATACAGIACEQLCEKLAATEELLCSVKASTAFKQY